MSDNRTPNPWFVEPPRHGKSWHLTRRNPKAPMGVEYLCTRTGAKRFRTREKAQREADRLNAALTQPEGGA